MKTINIALILIGFTVTAFHANATKTVDSQKFAVVDSLPKNLIDPVCKMKVPANAEKTSVFNKKTYYFCSESCKKKFTATPAKYIKNK